MDYIRPTPQQNPLLGLLAERLKQAQGFAAKPFGYSNPPVEMLMNLLGIPAVQQTMERMSYGEPLTTGRGMTTQVRPEVAEAALTVAPAAGLLAKATKGLPVGMSIKNVGDDILSYRGSHQAPNARRYGATLDDLTKILPDDVYSAQGKQLYGIGDKAIDSEWRIAALKTRNKPDAEVEVYRAVPKGVKDINDGDWVSTSKAYAKQHGENTLNGEYDIVSKKVKAKTLSTEGYPYEYGYNKEFEFPQQAALDTAQKNAALPISEGGLGLPPNNTPMDRAKAMGVDVDTYHGSTSPNIQQFDVSMSGAKSGNPFDDYIFTTNNPESASGYALNWQSYKKNVEGSPEFQALEDKRNALLKTLVKQADEGNFQNVGDIKQEISLINDQKTKLYNDFMEGKYVSEDATVYPLMTRSADYMPYEASGQNWMKANRPAIEASQEAGYSGVNIQNVKDNAGKGYDLITDTYATNNPSLLRSRFAAFDPMRRNEADILAGLLPASLLADPETRRKLDEELSLLYTK